MDCGQVHDPDKHGAYNVRLDGYGPSATKLVLTSQVDEALSRLGACKTDMHGTIRSLCVSWPEDQDAKR